MWVDLGLHFCHSLLKKLMPVATTDEKDTVSRLLSAGNFGRWHLRDHEWWIDWPTGHLLPLVDHLIVPFEELTSHSWCRIAHLKGRLMRWSVKTSTGYLEGARIREDIQEIEFLLSPASNLPDRLRFMFIRETHSSLWTDNQVKSWSLYTDSWWTVAPAYEWKSN